MEPIPPARASLGAFAVHHHNNRDAGAGRNLWGLTLLCTLSFQWRSANAPVGVAGTQEQGCRCQELDRTSLGARAEPQPGCALFTSREEFTLQRFLCLIAWDYFVFHVVSNERESGADADLKEKRRRKFLSIGFRFPCL